MTPHDYARLRTLAGTYAEYAHGTPMALRREKWRLHNTLQHKTFPFHIEDNGSFLDGLMPALECHDDDCRALEWHMARAITAYEAIDDDRIIPARFVVDWCTPCSPLCEELRFEHANNGTGLGYQTNRPVKNIRADWHKLTHRSMTLDRARTLRRADIARRVFDGLLPVQIGRVSSMYSDGITNKAVHLMGMQELYLQMAADPDAVHDLFAFLATDNLRLGRWEEQQCLLTYTHDGNQGYCTGSSFYTGDAAPPAGTPMTAAMRFGYLESQESAGISPAMFDEFLMPHLTRLAAQFKWLMFGCCEPVHAFMPLLQRLPGLRKVSVTPWCNLRVLADVCRPDVIWCRKPAPLTLCGTSFAEEAVRTHLQETLDIGHAFFIEFVYRDTNMLTPAMTERVAAVCRLIRTLTGHPEGTRL